MTKTSTHALPLTLRTRVGFYGQVTRHELGGPVCLGVIIGLIQQ